MQLFLEIVENASKSGRSYWLQQGDICRFGSDSTNELVLEDAEPKAGTIVYEPAGGKLYRPGGANEALPCGARIGAIQVREYPPSTLKSPGPISALIDWMRRLEGTLYAIFDAARDPQILKLLEAAQLKQLSLFDGDLRARMTDSAPYLVEIPKETAALELLVRASWGRGWASYLTCAKPFMEVRAHLRRSLMVELPSGQKAYFRFFDPAILQTFLRGSTAKEWHAFAGPITNFIAEQREGPAVAVHMYFQDGPKVETLRLVDLPC